MGKSVLILFLLTVAVTAFARPVKKRDNFIHVLDGFGALSEELPAHSGVERFLIEGFSKYQFHQPHAVPNERGGWNYLNQEREIEGYFSKYYLNDETTLPIHSPEFENLNPHQFRTWSREQLALGAVSGPTSQRILEALVGLHDRFDEKLSRLLVQDSILEKTKSRALEILDSVLNPPQFNRSPAKPKETELDIQATRAVFPSFIETYGIDPRERNPSEAVLRTIGFMILERRVSALEARIASRHRPSARHPRASAEAIFQRIYKIDPLNPPNDVLLNWGNKRYQFLHDLYNDLWAKARVEAELSPPDNRRNRTERPMGGEEVIVDYSSQPEILGRDLIEAFFNSLDRSKWQIYAEIRDSQPRQDRFELAFDPQQVNIDHLLWLNINRYPGELNLRLVDPDQPKKILRTLYFPESYLRTLHIEQTTMKTGGTGAGGNPKAGARPVYIPDLRRRHDLTTFLCLGYYGNYGFLDYTYARYSDFLFQGFHFRLQAYKVLLSLLVNLSSNLKTYEEARAAGDRDSVQSAIEELKETRKSLTEFGNGVYDAWFSPLFMRHHPLRSEHKSAFTGFELMRLLGAWHVLREPDYFEIRDMEARHRRRPRISAHFEAVQDRYGVDETFWRSNLERAQNGGKASPPKKSQSSNGQTQPQGRTSRFLGKVAQAIARNLPLTQNLSGETDGIRQTKVFHVPENKLDHIKGKLVVRLDSWNFTPVILFGPQRLDDTTPTELAQGTYNPLHKIRVTLLKNQPVAEGNILPLLSPAHCVLVLLNVYDEKNNVIPASDYTLLRSPWDGGYVIQFKSDKPPKSVRYHSYYRREPIAANLPNVQLNAAELSNIVNNFRAARADVVANGIESHALQTIEDIVSLFGRSSFYAKSTVRGISLAGDKPKDFSELVTLDNYFVGNCLPSHQFLDSVFQSTANTKSLYLRARTVLLMSVGSFGENEPLHANLFLRDRAGRTAWLDGTPRIGPLYSVSRPASSTIAQLIERSKRPFDWRSSLRSFSQTALLGAVTLLQRLGLMNVEEPDLLQDHPAVPNEPPKPTAAFIRQAWATSLDQNSAVYSTLSDEFKAFSVEYEKAMRNLRERGIERISDHSHPAWTVTQFSTILLSYARGSKSFDELSSNLKRLWNVSLDRAQQTPKDYLDNLRSRLKNAISLSAELRTEGKGNHRSHEELLLLTEAFGAKVLALSYKMGMEHWHTIEGILRSSRGTCVDSLTPQVFHANHTPPHGQ
ncbi:MAG: hypothetical protein AB7G93_20985 [Bdellovibrionales bacterium]